MGVLGWESTKEYQYLLPEILESHCRLEVAARDRHASLEGEEGENEKEQVEGVGCRIMAQLCGHQLNRHELPNW